MKTLSRDEVLGELRQQAEALLSEYGCHTPGVVLREALDIAIQQGGGCAWCGAEGFIIEVEDDDFEDSPPEPDPDPRTCPHCGGSGISPELAAKLTLIGIVAEDSSNA